MHAVAFRLVALATFLFPEAQASASTTVRSRGVRGLPRLQRRVQISRSAVPETSRRLFRHGATEQLGGARTRTSVGVGEQAEAKAPGQQRFAAAESTMLTVSENPEWKLDTYLTDVERVVHMTFPDSNRRKRVDENTWETQLLTQDLLGVKFQPVTTLRVSYDDNALRIRVSDLDLALPPQLQVPNPPILEVEGYLRPSARLPRNKVIMRGSVEIALTTALPAQFVMIPGVNLVIEGILKSIIGQLRASLENGIASDYDAWVADMTAGEQKIVVKDGDGDRASN
uniref:Uncharacterized protein n=1 Tax=Lotharella globosa TaxID=91324 RepID=A0A7S3YPV5_9EUKA